MPNTGSVQGEVAVTSYNETARPVKATSSFMGSDVAHQNLPATPSKSPTVCSTSA